jgi:hypothetical protein
VRSGTIVNPQAEIGMACQHFDLESADAPERPIRVSRDRPAACATSTARDLELARDDATGAVTHRDPPVRVIADCGSARRVTRRPVTSTSRPA